METNPELQDSITPDEEVSLEELANTDSPQDGVSVEEYQKVLETKNKLYARAKKAEEDRKNLREQLAQKPAEQPAPQPAADDIDVVLSLKSEGFTDAEVVQLRKEAKKYNTSVADLVQNPLIKAGIEAERAKQRQVEATPAPSNRSFSVKGKSWDDVAMNGTPDEQKAFLAEMTAKRGNTSE